MSTEVGKAALLDQQVRQAESFGVQDHGRRPTSACEDDRDRARCIRRGCRNGGDAAVALIVAGIAFARVQRAARRRRRRSSRSSPWSSTPASSLAALSQFFGTPLAYARARRCRARPTWRSSLPFLDESSFARAALGSMDLVHHLRGRQPRDRSRRALPETHWADRDHPARRLTRRSGSSSRRSNRSRLEL